MKPFRAAGGTSDLTPPTIWNAQAAATTTGARQDCQATYSAAFLPIVPVLQRPAQYYQPLPMGLLCMTGLQI